MVLYSGQEPRRIFIKTFVTATLAFVQRDAVSRRKPIVEDAVFGYRPAGAALLSNLSYQQGKVIHWDPDAMRLV